MSEFSDLHIHALFGVDDGAKTEEDMHAIIEAAYSDGTRTFCLTPHYHPGYFGENAQSSLEVFEKLKSYCAEKHPDVKLAIGNELRYSQACVSWVAEGKCRGLNGTKRILIDFYEGEKSEVILKALHGILNSGFMPILAHAERYPALHNFSEIARLRSDGIAIQLDAASVTGGYGFGAKLRSRKLLKLGLADIVSSDAHNITSRPPQMSDCYEYIAKNYGKGYARALCCDNGLEILGF